MEFMKPSKNFNFDFLKKKRMYRFYLLLTDVIQLNLDISSAGHGLNYLILDLICFRKFSSSD